MEKNNPLEEILVNSNIKISEDYLEILQIFSKKVEELNQNILEQKLYLNGGYSAKRDDSGKISGSHCGITNSQLRSLLMNYRIFHNNDEETNFFKIKNFIGRNYRSKQLSRLLKDEKKQWQQAGMFFDFCGLKQCELIDILINTQYFHVGTKEQRQKAKLIKEKITLEMEDLLVASAIHDRTRVLRNISWIIQPLLKGKLYIRLPKEHIAHLEESDAESLELDRLKLLEEERKNKFEEAKKKQKIFNATKSFDEKIISKVKSIHFGWGADAEAVCKKIPELDLDDAQGIINNVSNKYI